MDDNGRIVISGMGVVSPLGMELSAFHQALAQGRSGISTVQYPWETGYKTNHAGIVKDFEPSSFVEPERSDAFGRTTRLALAASKRALEDAGIDVEAQEKRIGVVVGTAMGEALEAEKVWQAADNQGAFRLEGKRPSSIFPFTNIHTSLASVFGLDGPGHLVTTTCAAGNHALGWAADLLRAGAADAMLAVGADTIGYVDMLGFSRLLLQAPVCCQPFDLHRKGTILSEGAGALLLEPLSAVKKRRAPILAEVAGCGLSCDAAGPFSGKVKEVRSLEIAAEKALKEARCSADAIDYISAHGSGTRLNDAKETFFIKKMLGEQAYQVPVSSIKSMLGHAQGAASALEAIACVLSFKHDLLYPTVNYQTPDPQCDLNYVPNQARQCRVDTILSNAFGVGGNNAILILKRWSGK